MSNITVSEAQQRNTDHASIDAALTRLRSAATDLTRCSIHRRIDLAEACLEGVDRIAKTWVETACEAKQIPAGSPARAEEITAGPVSVLRYLRLLIRTLDDIEKSGKPRLPGKVRHENGQCIVPVFPTNDLFDRLLFYPMVAETRLEPSVPIDNLFGEKLSILKGEQTVPPQVCCVLGAGNVAAIPATDVLTKILQDNCVVLLKMNPVNAYLGELFEQALAPLITAGYLAIVYGGADAGGYAVNHDQVDQVHVTGSIETHDAIVWGSREERESRKANNTPILNKPVTSELGNVSPWILTPGKYTDAQLRFQAEHIVASITNNASFNCIATKQLITWKECNSRDRLLGYIDEILVQVEPRFAYYPGAKDRFATYAGKPAPGDHLPWTLLRDVDITTRPELFHEESFVCVCGETRLDAESPQAFLETAVRFANEELWGTLAAAITVSPEFSKTEFLRTAVRELRYGTVGLNQWPGVSFALMSTPWGGFPGTSLRDAKSGIGDVHNTFLLDRPEKTVLSSPLTMHPKPMWFSTHRKPEAVAWKLYELYSQPTLTRLPGLLFKAIQG